MLKLTRQFFIFSAFFNKAMGGFWAVILASVNQDFTVKRILTILTEVLLKVRNNLTKFLRPAVFDFTKFFMVLEAFQDKVDEIDNIYDDLYQCLKCQPGCESCFDDSPCLATYNWVFR